MRGPLSSGKGGRRALQPLCCLSLARYRDSRAATSSCGVGLALEGGGGGGRWWAVVVMLFAPGEEGLDGGLCVV